mmetsp:Transcript_89393/g.182294  ORF Transcript_89393/g.182294 Transcript_89393/m.182294 type:complete len:93 (+) Transcript_89393:143-421(+)
MGVQKLLRGCIGVLQSREKQRERARRMVFINNNKFFFTQLQLPSLYFDERIPRRLLYNFEKGKEMHQRIYLRNSPLMSVYSTDSMSATMIHS